MKLSKRLETIASMVPKTTQEGAVADVGTDHGFIPIWLVEHGIAARAIAMDVRKGPLARAREHICEHHLEEKIETRLSDGLEQLAAGDAETVVIAGMGGELILRILTEGDHVRDSVAHWICSPQSELSAFRHGIERLGLAIKDETMLFEDGKYYTVMHLETGTMHYAHEYEYRYGALLIQRKSPVLSEFLKKEMQQYREIIAHLKEQQSEGARARLGGMEQELQEMEEAYNAM